MLGGVSVVLLLLIGSILSAEDYQVTYQKGAYLIESGDCANGKSAIEEGLKVAPKSNIQKNYFPHYYLAICAVQDNDLDSAEKYLKQAEGGGIYFSGLAKEFKTLKDRVKAKRKESPQSVQQKSSLVILVNPANGINDISLSDLSQIFKGQKQTWSDNTRIIPVLGPENSSDNQRFLSAVCQVDEKKLQDLWQGQQVNGTKLPVFIEKQEWILPYVYSNPGAIAFSPPIAANPQVKIITVDGKNSSAPDYPLK